MQPSNFVQVKLDNYVRKDEWINSRLDRLTLSRKLTANIVPNGLLGKKKVISSQLQTTDRVLRTHSIINHHEDSKWAEQRKLATSSQFANDSKGFTLNRKTTMTSKKSVDSDS